MEALKLEEDRREKDGRIRIFAGGTMLVIENGVLLSCEGECEGTLEIPLCHGGCRRSVCKS